MTIQEAFKKLSELGGLVAKEFKLGEGLESVEYHKTNANNYEFVQSERMELLAKTSEKLGSQETRTKISKSGGICQSLCYDWIRRVLQNGKLHFGEKKGDLKELKATYRAGFAQTSFMQPKVSLGIINQQYNVSYALHELLTKSQNLKFQLDVELEKKLVHAGRIDRKKKDTTGFYTRDYLQQVYSKVGKQNDRSETNTFAKKRTEWQFLGYEWDNAWMKVRGTLSSRPFHNIDRVKVTDYQDYSSVYDAIADPLRHLPNADMAIKIGFHTKNDGTEGGHALGVFRNKTGKYFFFDPNYGIFEYQDIETVAAALVFDIAYSYTKDESPQDAWQTVKKNKHCETNFDVFVPAKVEVVPTVFTVPLLDNPQFKQRVLQRVEKLITEKVKLSRTATTGNSNKTVPMQDSRGSQITHLHKRL